jgi:hypothetical protein
LLKSRLPIIAEIMLRALRIGGRPHERNDRVQRGI